MSQVEHTRPSKTSIYVAAGRAVGAREPDPAVRNPDFLIERLLGPAGELAVDHPAVHALDRDYTEAMTDPEVLGCVVMMMVRTRFIDEGLRRSIEGGAAQVVILGAGFDTRASRFADLLAGVPVFEVDRPETQEVKERRVREALGGPPPNLTYVPIDFRREELADVLAAYGHATVRRTFFICEGVSMYLPAAAVESTFAFVGTHPSGSSIVFDYVYQGVIDMIAKIDLARIPEPMRAGAQRFLNLIADEPWIFGLPRDGERAYLGRFGLEPHDLLPVGGPESIRRYLTRSDGTTVGGLGEAQRDAGPGGVYHLMHAVVTGNGSRV